MPHPVNNIIDTKYIQQRTVGVQSLAHVHIPQDTLRLTQALHTSLELEEVLGLFRREIENHVALDGLTFRHDEHGITVRHGGTARHRASYALSLQEESLGEVTFSRDKPFAEQELALVEHLLCPLLYPLRNALRYRQALAAAFRDPLTGLHNRAALEESLPREVELAHRHKLALSMVIIDLDLFKRINDDYGHAAGDSVLRTTARRMKNALRTSDRLFRFGGDEFVLLLPATDLAGAAIVAERLRQALETEQCVCEGVAIPVTASIGLAQLGAGDDRHTLFEQADKAVYRAKALGRNQVMFYED